MTDEWVLKSGFSPMASPVAAQIAARDLQRNERNVLLCLEFLIFNGREFGIFFPGSTSLVVCALQSFYVRFELIANITGHG
jgi:hypothetical protein